MAERRMFSKNITDSDAFLDLPLTTQALYFHLSMQADDDGFVNSPKKIQRAIGAKPSDLDLLIEKRFVLMFDSGVIAIKHWRMNNYIRADRYKKTVHAEERAQLYIKNNGAYTTDASQGSQMVDDGEAVGIPSDNQADTERETNGSQDEVGIPSDNQWYTQNRLDKDSIDKISLDEDRLDKCSVDNNSRVRAHTKDDESRPSSIREVVDYFTANGFMQPVIFFEHYEKTGWSKDWKELAAEWEQRRLNL